MLGEAKFLLCKIESKGISLDGHEIFSNLIEAYVGEGELGRAITVYDRMRGQGLVPSMMCCCVLLDLLVQKKKIQSVYQVCWDMLEMNVNLSDVETSSFENVIKLLCMDRKIQEGRNLVNRVVVSGLEPCSLVVNEIARGYYENKDSKDLLSFFARIGTGK